MAALLRNKVAAAAAGVLLLVLFASVQGNGSGDGGVLGDEVRLQDDICSLCFAESCMLEDCPLKCPGLCSAGARQIFEHSFGPGREDDQLRQPDYYCVLCWQKRCPASCRSGCPRYCGRATTE